MERAFSSEREPDPDQQPVLVTGASGFIGGRLVRRLLESGARVSCLVRTKSRIGSLNGRDVQLITGDVTDRAGVERALHQSRAHTVFHLAGLVRARSRDDFERVNAGGVETMSAACAAQGNAPVLVVVSSLAAAGPCGANQVCDESDIPAPVSVYGRSKLAGEQAAMRYAQVVPITIVRPPIVFGPGDQGLLQMFRPIAKWGIHLVPGGRRSGERRYSLVFVDDLVEALVLAARKGERLCRTDRPGQGIYFVAGVEPQMYTQLGLVMAAALGRNAPVMIRLPGPLAQLAGVIGDMTTRFRGPGVHSGWVSRDKVTEVLAGSWMCSSTKIREQLGWSPLGTLAERMTETADWYRDAGWL